MKSRSEEKRIASEEEPTACEERQAEARGSDARKARALFRPARARFRWARAGSGLTRAVSPFGLSLFPFSFQLAALVLLFFATSVVGVVTGSNSLITVPAMYQLGIDARVAVATNMFGLTFMSAGGAIPFIGKGSFDGKRLPLLVGLTLAGSTAGALLVLVVSSSAMPLLISLSMLAVAAFSIASRSPRVGRDAGLSAEASKEEARGEVEDEKLSVEDEKPASSALKDEGGRAFVARAGRAEIAGYAATFALGVYGGFYSGGYVTMLTAAYVSLFRMRFVEAVATTKIVNVFSSLVATLVFMRAGLVDYKLGALLAVVMFAGAFVGARVALKLKEESLRRIFLATVVALALKILLYDFLWKGLLKG